MAGAAGFHVAMPSEHIDDARAAVRWSILAEPAGDWDRERIASLAGDVPVIAVPGPSPGGEIAARFGQAAQSMRIVGVTGTNGKTSVVSFSPRRWRPGCRPRCWAVGNGFPGDLQPSTHHARCGQSARSVDVFARGTRAGDGGVVARAGPGSGRRCPVPIPLCSLISRAITRITTAACRRTPMRRSACSARPDQTAAVINIDDPVGARLATDVRPRVFTVAVGKGSERSAWVIATCTSAQSSHGLMGLRVSVRFELGRGRMHTHLLGGFNALNLCLVLATLLAWDMPLAAALNALGDVQPVLGRMMTFVAPRRPRVVVDYARTRMRWNMS